MVNEEYAKELGSIDPFEVSRLAVMIAELTDEKLIIDALIEFEHNCYAIGLSDGQEISRYD